MLHNNITNMFVYLIVTVLLVNIHHTLLRIHSVNCDVFDFDSTSMFLALQ